MTKAQSAIIDRVNDPRISNLGNIGVALIKAARANGTTATQAGK